MILDERDHLTQPDGFIGSMMAIEGLADGCTILNGPNGCKGPMGELAKDSFRRENDLSEMRWAEEFYFGQDRLPNTYLDDHDYVYGAAEKLEYVFPRVADKGYSFIGVLNSPGASLIGDDLQRYLDWSGIRVPAAVLDRLHFGAGFDEGWLDAAATLIETLSPAAQEVQPHTVNLVGMSLWHRHWAGSLGELARLLGLCGIRVHAALLAGCTAAEVKGLRRAALNLVVHEELGAGLAEHLSRRYGMPWAASQRGAPLGFDATEAWIELACGELGVDPTPALASIAGDRRRAAEKLYRCTAKVGYPRGARFSVLLDASLAAPLVEWLCEYLAMIPASVQVPDENQPAARRVHAYLEAIGAGQAWNAPLDRERLPEAIFSNDGVILRLLRDQRRPVGLSLAMPAKEALHFTPRSVLGASGAMRLLEDLCNGLWALA